MHFFWFNPQLQSVVTIVFQYPHCTRIQLIFAGHCEFRDDNVLVRREALREDFPGNHSLQLWRRHVRGVRH